MNLEIYDCTLREGEQANGVNFSQADRIKIAQLLDQLGVDYIELGWPIARKDIFDSFIEVQKLKLNAKIVAFGSTSISENTEKDPNLESIILCGAKYACIFGKSSLSHVEKQLRITPEENLKKIFDSIRFLKNHNIEVFYDAEHFFDAFKESPEYALKTIQTAQEAGASRIILCDTNGGCLPEEIKKIIEEVSAKMDILGIHCHNDCGLALANSLAGLPYIKQMQLTVNGIGERVGNADLCEAAPIIELKLGQKTKIKLDKLKKISEEVYRASNLPSQITQAFVSPRAFLHKGGIHVDATIKGASYEHIDPRHLGLGHEMLLTSLGGSACVINTAKKFGYNLDKNNPEVKEKIKQLLIRLSELESKGYDLGNIEAEQEIIIEKFFGNFINLFKVLEWKISTSNEESVCSIKCRINDKNIEKTAKAKWGPVDAAYLAMSEAIGTEYDMGKLKLSDYKVRIAKSCGAESSVRTRIAFSNDIEFETTGVSENIIASSIEALEKGLNYYLSKNTGFSHI